MMEFSDDSFAWTDTTNETEDNDISCTEEMKTMSKTNKIEDNEIENSESNNRKKKRMFEEHHQSMCDIEPPRKRSKHKQIKVEQGQDEIRETYIKLEPDSDDTVPINKATSSNNKKNRKPLKDSDISSDSSVPPHDSYLELRVKQEQSSGDVKSHRKQKLESIASSYELNTDNLQATNTKKTKQSKKSKIVRSDNSNEINVDSGLVFAKEEASRLGIKKSRESDSESINVEDMIIEEKFISEETVVGNPYKQISNRDSVSNDLNIDNENVSNAVTGKKNRKCNSKADSKKTKNKQDKNFSSREYVTDNNSSSEDEKNNYETYTRRNSTKNKSIDSDKDNNCNFTNGTASIANSLYNHDTTSKLSERIRFENEEDMNLERSQSDDEEVMTPQLKKFLKANPKLRLLIYKTLIAPVVTVDDDIYIIKCPHEINIDTLINNNLLLDSKCKLKSNGHTYDGYVNKNGNKLALLSFESQKNILKNITLNGTINFRKRIPKPHFMEDNIIENNQTNFIPLPDTKCRHPLFGADYKKSVKVPASVKARLARSKEDCHGYLGRKEKKKIKTEKVVIEPLVQPKCEPEQEYQFVIKSKQKKNKMKMTDIKEESPTKKLKQMKHDLGLADTWESEKAIEESLFNF